MSIMFTNTKQAQSVQASQRGKKALGSKTLTLGKEYALLLPKKDNVVVCAGIVGRNCNRDDIGISFARIYDNQMEQNPETGRITDNSGLRKWAALSNILYKAAQAKEIAEAEEEAAKLAEKTGSKIDEGALAQRIDQIKIAYEGQLKQGDIPAILPSKQRLISSSVNFSVFTEGVLVPLDKNLKPEFDAAISVEVRLSNKKQKDINDILDNPQYNDMDDPDGFLEVKFSYKGADAKEAGKNPYQGVEAAIRKVNLKKDENGKYIDEGTRSIVEKLNDVSHDPVMIFNRAGTVSFAKTSADAEAGMRKFLSTNRILPTFIDMEDEQTKNHAQDILDLNCVFGKDTKQYRELQEMAAAVAAERAGNDPAVALKEMADDMNAGVRELAQATDTKKIAETLEGNEELKKMVEDEGISDI